MRELFPRQRMHFPFESFVQRPWLIWPGHGRNGLFYGSLNWRGAAFRPLCSDILRYITFIDFNWSRRWNTAQLEKISRKKSSCAHIRASNLRNATSPEENFLIKTARKKKKNLRIQQLITKHFNEWANERSHNNTMQWNCNRSSCARIFPPTNSYFWLAEK